MSCHGLLCCVLYLPSLVESSNWKMHNSSSRTSLVTLTLTRKLKDIVDVEVNCAAASTKAIRNIKTIQEWQRNVLLMAISNGNAWGALEWQTSEVCIADGRYQYYGCRDIIMIWSQWEASACCLVWSPWSHSLRWKINAGFCWAAGSSSFYPGYWR